jgi:L-alanine-DL-glutamate epimerase-like enolase superfamily enzyme
MKITGVQTTLVNVPIGKPLKTSIHDIRSVGCVLVFIDTDAGISGEGYIFTLSAKRLDVFSAMILSLKGELLGEDPHYTERIWQKLWRELNFFGHKGVSIFAISALDMACWDLVGKAAGKPLYHLFGGCRDRVPVYASAGLWLSASIDELVKEAKDFKAEGFMAMKLRVGKARVEEDVERVTAVRQAIGSEAGLMIDANQGFTVEHAIRLGRKLEEFNLIWFEEPVPAYDLEGSSRVAAALDVPIASGETEYTRYGFRQMLELKAADILMPDLARVGGFTEFLKVAHMAEAYEVPVSPHIFTEQSLQILGSVPNGTYLEHMPWFAALFREKISVKDGTVDLPPRPATGFTLDPQAIDRYRIKG